MAATSTLSSQITRTRGLEYRSDLIFCAAAVFTVLMISAFSGYHAVPIPADIGWQFSPLGLLQKFDPAYFDLEIEPIYAGKAGLTFDYAIVFFKTCALESPFYFWATRSLGGARSLSILLGANLLTHPAVFFLFAYLSRNYLTMALSAEAFAAIAEMLVMGGVLHSHGARTRTVVAGVLLVWAANLFSWQLGAFI